MIKKIRLLLTIFLPILMLSLIGCSSTDPNSSNNGGVNPTTKEDYNAYLTERYNYYFNDSTLVSQYNVYKTDFDYNASYDKFISKYTNSYNTYKENLRNLKIDLENNVNKGNSEVDNLNQQVLDSINESIINNNNYTSALLEKVK